MYEFLLLSDLEGLKSALEIFKEQSHVIRIVAPATFFKKAVQKIFRKCLEKRLGLTFTIFASLQVGK